MFNALYDAHSRLFLVLEGAESEWHKGEAFVHLGKESSRGFQLELVHDVPLLEHRRAGVFLSAFAVACLREEWKKKCSIAHQCPRVHLFHHLSLSDSRSFLPSDSVQLCFTTSDGVELFVLFCLSV